MKAYEIKARAKLIHDIIEEHLINHPDATEEMIKHCRYAQRSLELVAVLAIALGDE